MNANIAASVRIVFDTSTINVEPIREQDRYGGLRARLVGHLEKTRCAVQIEDFFDIRMLIREGALDPENLGKAIAATFTRRRTALPADMTAALSDEFASDDVKRKQWKAFLGKNRIDAPELGEVVKEIREALAEALNLAQARSRRASAS